MRQKIRKRIASIVVLVVLITCFTGCGKNNKNKENDVVITIGTASGSLCLAPLHIALDNGYFEDEFKAAGITWKVEEIDIQQASELLASGKIDACVGLAGSLIPQIDSGLDISFTGGLHTGCTKYYVQKDSDIESVEDLRGKKIGVPGLSDSSVIALKRKLYDAGIGVSADNMEVEFVPYNLTDLPLALANGAVDAIALHDPVAYSAEEEYDFKKILDLTTDEKFKNEYCCQIYVTNKLALEHPKAAAAYTRALLKAAAYVQADPEGAAKLQLENKQCSGDLETNASLLASYNYTPSVSLAYQTFFDASNELLRIGELQEGRDINEFAEEHFKKFDDVPDSYVYNEDSSFTEVKE